MNKPIILAVIPARSGSKGIPGKNTAILCGKPLIAYTIETAILSEWIDKVIVSTDSERIASISLEFGAEVPFLRPADLADDHTPMHLVNQHVISALARAGYFPDALVNMYPTQPFRRLKTVEFLLQKFAEGFSSIAAYSMISQPEYGYVLKSDNLRLKRLLDDGLDTISNRYVMKSGYLYGKLLDENRGVFDEYALCVSDFRETLEIDEPEDFYFAEYVILNNHYPF